MGNDERLVDLLARELNRLDDSKEREKFQEALKTELPRAIRKAAKKAKINGSKGD